MPHRRPTAPSTAYTLSCGKEVLGTFASFDACLAAHTRLGHNAKQYSHHVTAPTGRVTYLNANSEPRCSFPGHGTVTGRFPSRPNRANEPRADRGTETGRSFGGSHLAELEKRVVFKPLPGERS